MLNCFELAYCLRFVTAKKCYGPLGAEEINRAELRALKLLQSMGFPDDLRKLRAGEFSKTKFANLNPFFDENGLVRIGGRLRMSEITPAQKHPVILSSKHRLTDNIIRETHEKHYHAGIQTTYTPPKILVVRR